MRARTQREDYRHSRPRHQHGPAMGLLNQRRRIRQVPGRGGQEKFILAQSKITLAQAWRALGQAMCILTVLTLSYVPIASADAPTQVSTPTPTSQESNSVPISVATLPASTAQGSTIQQATPTPTPEAPSTPTPVPDATPVPTPTLVVPTPTLAAPTSTVAAPTPFAPLSGTAYLAIRVSDCVLSVGGTANSEVFVLLRDIQPGVEGFHLSLHFDPQIVHIVDADSDAANGIQIAPAPFVNGTQRVTENQGDNVAGDIVLTVTQNGGTPVHETSSWHKVATLTWAGQREGNSVVAIGSASYFVGHDGQEFVPDAVHNGTLFVRAPGQILGAVRLQGREGEGGALVTSALTAARIDQARTAVGGRFTLTTSHGEGFYTLTASAPGYLSAESHRPIKITVGSAIDLGEVTLYGGDATGDNRIDVRDLSYVAWHFDSSDAKADINGDGQVDILDLSLVAGNFGQVGPTVWQVPAAP